MVRFFLSILAAAIFIVAFLFWMHHIGVIRHLPSFFRETLVLLVITTALIYKYLYSARKPALFVQLYLGTMAIKLLAYGGFCFWIILKDKPGAIANLAFFMVVYLVFTALEITFLFNKISRSE